MTGEGRESSALAVPAAQPRAITFPGQGAGPVGGERSHGGRRGVIDPSGLGWPQQRERQRRDAPQGASFGPATGARCDITTSSFSCVRKEGGEEAGSTRSTALFALHLRTCTRLSVAVLGPLVRPRESTHRASVSACSGPRGVRASRPAYRRSNGRVRVRPTASAGRYATHPARAMGVSRPPDIGPAQVVRSGRSAMA
jgi:hypothetical protein